MNIDEAKQALDKVIDKARVHLYKPIQNQDDVFNDNATPPNVLSLLGQENQSKNGISVSSDRIVIVCKDTEEKVIVSLLNQMGWKSKIQSILTESDLIIWYEKAMRGKFAALVGGKVLKNLIDEIQVEFPATDSTGLLKFMNDRDYTNLQDETWQ